MGFISDFFTKVKCDYCSSRFDWENMSHEGTASYCWDCSKKLAHSRAQQKTRQANHNRDLEEIYRKTNGDKNG